MSFPQELIEYLDHLLEEQGYDFEYEIDGNHITIAEDLNKFPKFRISLYNLITYQIQVLDDKTMYSFIKTTSSFNILKIFIIQSFGEVGISIKTDPILK